MTKKRKKEIEEILNTWTYNKKSKSYVSLTAFKSQIDLMNSFRKQYFDKGDLSDKQIDVAKKIIKQNRDFSAMWRSSRVMY